MARKITVVCDDDVLLSILLFDLLVNSYKFSKQLLKHFYHIF